MPQYPIRTGYIPELNGLRGIAILMVMIFHAGAPFLRGGFIGVDVFFVLSGFLITFSLLQEHDKSGNINFKRFYIRRFLRLGPALITLIIIFCVASFYFLDNEKAFSNYVDALISLAYLSNWAAALGLHPPDFLRHTWSLSVEEQFYMLWPILLWALLKSKMKNQQIAVITICIAIGSWLLRIYLYKNSAPTERLYAGLDTRLDGLMIGCSTALIISKFEFVEISHKKITKHLSYISPIAASLLLLFSMLTYNGDPKIIYFGFIISNILASILIIDVLINKRSILLKILTIKSLVWIGTISYGLYLWHYPVYRVMLSMGFHGLGLITLGSLITFIIATASYYFIEAPILSLKKKLTPLKSREFLVN